MRVGTVQQQENESSEVEDALAGLLLRRGAEAWLLDAIHLGKQSPQDDQKGACKKTCQGPAAQAGSGGGLSKMDSLRPGVSLMYGPSAGLALTQVLRNHALRPPITRGALSEQKLQKCYGALDAVTGSVEASRILLASEPHLSQNMPKHAPANFQASATTSKILARKIRLKRKNIQSFSYCFGSKIRHHPRGTVSFLPARTCMRRAQTCFKSFSVSGSAPSSSSLTVRTVTSSAF